MAAGKADPLNNDEVMKNIILLIGFLFVFASCNEKKTGPSVQVNIPVVTDTLKQKAILEKIVSLLPPDLTSAGRVSFLDSIFPDWLKRTGELPPDFDRMPSIPFLPDPLVIDEGGKNLPIKTMAQWKEKREWMKKQLEYYITGTYPPKPDNLKARILNENKEGETIVRMVELSFGPADQAKLTVELMVPPGQGPFPVFMTQWNHREWALIAVRRGYIGCVYAGADLKDDTEKYSEIWAGQYDFTRLMRRSYGASRAIDYLYTLPYVDKEKIGLTGHSRNGDLSYIAAAFDERITAVIPSSGTGMDIPWRYSATKYDIEDLVGLSCGQPSWFHPRLRFFVGRENKLPVDNNFFMALIAPRGLMMSTSLNETHGNPWGSEQAYLSTLKVYKFLGAQDNLAIRLRYGLHSICARDMEDYMDFFDYVFKRSDHRPENRLFYNYSFDKWCEFSGEKIDPKSFPVKGIDDLLIDEKSNNISSISDWESKKSDIRKRLRWVLGDEPPGVINPGPGSLEKGGRGENNFGSFLIRPQPTGRMGMMALSPYNGFGDNLFGYLYYPRDKQENLKNEKSPVVIYLHEYDYSKGFNTDEQEDIESLLQSIVERGYAVFSYDMLGFGNRIEEGTRFYHRYPHWSKMGKMVVDVKGAVEALSNLDFIDSTKIYVAGYSLGATVGLYAAAMDERITGVVSVAGFTPLRLNTLDRGTEGIKAYSHLHGLLPRLGFFVGNEGCIPYDFHEILACIAPRPILVIAPVLDKDAILSDVEYCVSQAGKIYGLYGAAENIQIFSPDDYSRYSPEMRERTYKWLEERLIASIP
jgi:cephalosporin-C deacetylase-like acetyl esterase